MADYSGYQPRRKTDRPVRSARQPRRRIQMDEETSRQLSVRLVLMLFGIVSFLFLRSDCAGFDNRPAQDLPEIPSIEEFYEHSLPDFSALPSDSSSYYTEGYIDQLWEELYGSEEDAQ